MSRFRFVDDHRDVYDVKRLCRLAEVSRSGFYAWLSRGPSRREQSDTELLDKIEQIHTESRRTYGAPRVHGQLRRGGVRVGCKRVARLMRANGLVGACSRPKIRRLRPDVVPAGDLLHRDFSAPRPNMRWVGDITEFLTGEGKLYLAGVRDLCHRGIVGWATGEHQDAELVVEALTNALRRCTPDRDGLIHHVDHGTQYTSLAFCAAVDLSGLQVSFGSVGDCYDNAAMETFWATLKRETAWIRGSLWFRTRREAHLYLFEYIEIFYNRQRHQAALGHLTPAEYAATFQTKHS